MQQATSLLICSRDRPRLLLDTVLSVLQGTVVPSEIVIIDQSRHPHEQLSQWPADQRCQVRYVLSRSVGLSRARNEALATASHDLLVIIDDDMFVQTSWFGTFTRALIEAGPRTVITGRVLPTAPEVPHGFAPTVAVREAAALYQGRIGTEVLAGGHMAAFRSAFEEVGGFDERLGAGSLFPAADDNDLGYRFLEAGYRIAYVPDAVVYHRAWRPVLEYFVVRWNYGLGKGGYYAKYLSLTDRYMLRRMLHDITHRIYGFPLRLWRDPRLASGDPAYIMGILVGAVRWLLTQPRGGPAARLTVHSRRSQ
jgi:glycosyltransferase involved in cell wall biosynthesis